MPLYLISYRKTDAAGREEAAPETSIVYGVVEP